MNEEAVKQIVDEILSSFEPLEAQSAALLQFLKAKGLANDEELAPFLDQAANAANVRWLAVRVRTAALIANAMKPAENDKSENDKSENDKTTSAEPAAQSNEETAQTGRDQATQKSGEQDSEPGNQKDRSEQVKSKDAKP